MAVHRCPQCGAPMRADFVGTMSDKVMRCDYCGTVVDVPDTSTVAESTTTRATGPGGLTVTTTRKKVLSRSDGVSDAGGAGDDKVVELDLAGLLGLSGGFGSAERGLDRREITLTATSRTSRRGGQISGANAGGSTSSAARRGPHTAGVRIPLWLIVIAATLALIIAIVVLA